MKRFSRFANELRRRNVFRAGAAYLVLAWLAVQVADVVLDAFESPAWIIQTIVVALAVGFPVTLVLAWVYEITTTGIKRTEDVAVGESIAEYTGRRLDFIVIGVLLVAVAIFALDRFVWQPFEKVTDTTSHNYSIAVLPFQLTSEQVAPFFGQLSNDLSRLLQRSDQLRVASIDAIESLPANSNTADIAARLGVRYLVSGAVRFEGAGVSVFVSLFDDDADSNVWTSDFADAHLQRTNNAVAEAILVEIGGHPISLPSSTVDPMAYQLYLRAKQRLTAEELREEAENLFREALTLDARFPLALAGLCSFLVRRYQKMEASTDFEEAERLCYRAWTIDSRSAEVQWALGNLYQTSGQLEKARESYAAALAINPSNFSVQRALAFTYHDAQPELAEIQLKRIIEQHPGSPDAYISLAHLYFKQGKYEEAVGQARWVVRLLPDNEQAKFNLASYLMGAGMFSEAKSLSVAMLENESLRSGSVESNLATILFFEGDYGAAARLYRAAIDREPEESLFYRNLGDAIWHLDGIEAAQPIFRSAIDLARRQLEINPSDYYVVGDLMISYASVGDSDNFQRSKNTLLELNTTDPQTHYGIAVAASRLGDKETARLHAEKAHELGYPLAWLRADPDISASGASFD